MDFVFSPQPPFDFQKMMKRLIGAQKSQLVHISGDLTEYERIVRHKGAAFYLSAKSKGSVDKPAIHCFAEMVEGSITEEDVEEAVKRIFSFDMDLTEFYRTAQAQTKLAALCRQFNGLRLVTDTDLFETVTKIIIGQQVNLTFAGTLINRLTERAGTHVEFNGKMFQMFPKAEEVAKLDYSQLRELQFSQRKAEYIIDLARMEAGGTLNLNDLWHKTDEEIMQTLLPLRGIGRWTVECLLIFGMGRPDVLPAADIGLRNGVKMVWEVEHQPSEEEVRELAKDWAPWRTYVTYYLWESLAKEPAVLQKP